MKLRIACHSQTYGQAECKIQTIEDMIRASVMYFKGSWDNHLMLIEFSYNNSYHRSISMALVYPVFYVSMLKKCIVDPESILPIEG